MTRRRDTTRISNNTGDGTEAASDLQERIRRSYTTLSGGQQRVARQLLSLPDEAVFLSSAELGRRAGVSDSTVIRMADALGYQGYPELRQALQRSLTQRLTPTERFRQRLGGKVTGDALLASLDSDLENLQRLRSGGTRSLWQAVEMILKARTVYVIGLRSSFGLASNCAFLLELARGNAQLVHLLGGELPDQVRAMGREDLVIAFSFPRYSRETVTVVEHAVKLRCPTIAITDSLLAPISGLAMLTFQVEIRGEAFFHSNVAALALVNALVTGVARRRRTACMERLATIESFREAFGLIAEPDDHVPTARRPSPS